MLYPGVGSVSGLGWSTWQVAGPCPPLPVSAAIISFKWGGLCAAVGCSVLIRVQFRLALGHCSVAGGLLPARPSPLDGRWASLTFLSAGGNFSPPSARPWISSMCSTRGRGLWLSVDTHFRNKWGLAHSSAWLFQHSSEVRTCHPGLAWQEAGGRDTHAPTKSQQACPLVPEWGSLAARNPLEVAKLGGHRQLVLPAPLGLTWLP